MLLFGLECCRDSPAYIHQIVYPHANDHRENYRRNCGISPRQTRNHYEICIEICFFLQQQTQGNISVENVATEGRNQ